MAATFLVATSFPVVASIAGAMDSVVLTLLRFALASLLFLPLVQRHASQWVTSVPRQGLEPRTY